MASQPAPASTGGSPRTPAPSQPAPGSISGSARTPAPSQPAPGSTRGSPWASAPFHLTPCATGGSRRSTGPELPRGARKYVVLTEWYLERVEGEDGKIRVAGATYIPQSTSDVSRKGTSSKGFSAKPGRTFRSSAIVKRHDYNSIEDEDGRLINTGFLDKEKTRENGFSEKVCTCFEGGFPERWCDLVDPKMVLDNEHARSSSETAASAARVDYYVERLLSDDFITSVHPDCTLEDIYSFLGAVPPSSPPGEPTRLRSGKVLGLPSGGPMKRSHQQKKEKNQQ